MKLTQNANHSNNDADAGTLFVSYVTLTGITTLRCCDHPRFM